MRTFLKIIATLCLALGTTPARATPPLDGAFFFLGYAPGSPSVAASELTAYFDEMAALKMNTVIIAASRQRAAPGCSGAFTWLPHMPDQLGPMLDMAQARGIQLYLGLSMSNGCGGLDFGAAGNTAEVVADVNASLQAFAPLLGHAALGGFYIPDEPGLAWPSLEPYYKAVTDAVHAHSPKPVAVAPYLVNVNPATFPPATVAAQAAHFQAATGVQIQMWQDSVGADSIPLDPWARPGKVSEYFAAIRGAIGDAFWADVELFGGPLGGDFSDFLYRPASLRRVTSQLDTTVSAKKRVSWLPQFHMGSVDQHRYVEADRLLRQYKAAFGIAGQVVTPTAYHFETPPAGAYPDRGGQLTDGKAGDPKAFSDPTWIGVSGEARIVLDLAARSRIDWVAVHLLNDPTPDIAIPDSLNIFCSDDGQAWTLATSVKRPFTPSNKKGEYTFANGKPLAIDCAHLKLTLPNAHWTFLAEVELTADGTGAPAVTTPAQAMDGPIEESSTLPPTTAAPVLPPPTVVLVAQGSEYPGTAAATPPTATMTLAAGGNGYAVSLRGSSPLPPGYQCRLDRDGVSGVLFWDPNAYHQLDLATGAAGTNSSFCAYCYGPQGQSQTGSCLLINFQ